MFFGIAFISALKTTSKLGALNWLFYSFFTGFMIFKFLISKDCKFMQKVLDVFFVCGFINFFYGLVEYFLNFSFILKMSMGRFTSLLGHPLSNAFLYGILLFFALFRYKQTKRNFYLIFACCAISVILLSLSRGAWFAVGLIFITLTFMRRFKIKYLFLVTFVLMVGNLTPVGEIVLERLLTNEDIKHSSWNVRTESFKIGVEMIKERPWLGVGLFNSKRYKRLFTHDPVLERTTFENSYLEIVIETGMFAGGFYLIIILYVFFLLFFKKSKRNGLIIAAFLFMVLHAATFNVLNVYRTAHFIYWSILAIVLKLNEPLLVNQDARDV
jgi:O-antigen ligase